MTGGAESGNKIRKLEYLLSDARNSNATVVLTSGGLQSNHCRATAIASRQLGMRPLLVLRGRGPKIREAGGNLLLDRLVGAEIHHVPNATSADSESSLAEAAERLKAIGERPYIIPEGGSNGLGALGYVDAMQEIAAESHDQLKGSEYLFDAVVHACGSGGTAAGVIIGAGMYRVASRVISVAVCDDSNFFQKLVPIIMAEARSLRPGLASSNPVHFEVLDHCSGALSVAGDRELHAFISKVARTCGIVLDPTYTGKALYALSIMALKPKRVCFIHTGGLPNTLLSPSAFTSLDP